ncbi:response regulator transcription factor [Nocardioides immobilis]|nr:response regulator transcription factor [Nocardioides immobilis]
MPDDSVGAVRILIVDDHEVVREGLSSVLASDPRYEVVGTAENGRSALEIAARTRPQVAIVDFRLPDMSGDEVCRQLLRARPDLRVIMLSSYLNERLVRQALTAGAAGYLTKGSGLAALRKTLDEVIIEHRSAAPHDAPQIVQQLHDLLSKQVATAPPTPQQQAVLDLAADGLTYHEIGARLFISESTVRFHIQNLKNRFGARSKTDLIAKAIQAGYVQPPDERFLGSVAPPTT